MGETLYFYKLEKLLHPSHAPIELVWEEQRGSPSYGVEVTQRSGFGFEDVHAGQVSAWS